MATNEKTVEESPSAYITPAPSFWNKLPPWISTNIRSKKSIKLLFRCWLASWIGFVILLPNKSLATLGNAGFFTLIVSLMLPPSMPVQMFLFVISTLVVGLLLGWAFGAAAMRAAVASRDQVLLRAALQRVQESVAGLSNPDELFQVDIFKAYFLDTRSSVVFGCFLGVASFLFALLRSYAPKLVFLSIFATIAADIFCSYGPLFPFTYYTLLNSVLISIACYAALAVVLITFVFPETINHSYLSAVSDVLEDVQRFFRMQEGVLGVRDLTQLHRESELQMGIAGLRTKLVGMQQQLTAKLAFVELEFSWGRWNSDDLKSLQDPLKALTVRVAGLRSLAKLLGHPSVQVSNGRVEQASGPGPELSLAPSVTTAQSNTTDDENENGDAGIGSGTATPARVPSDANSDTYLLHQIYQRNEAAEAAHCVRTLDMLPVIDQATRELREACVEGLGDLKRCVDVVNTKRWKWRDDGAEMEEVERRLEEGVVRVKKALEDFKGGRRGLLLEPYMSLFNKTKDNENEIGVGDAKSGFLPLRSLYLAYVFSANLISSAEATRAVMELVRDIIRTRKRNRLWAPKGLRTIGSVLIGSRKGLDEDGQALGEDVPPVEVENAGEVDEEGEGNKDFKMDPDSRPPKNFVQRIMNFIHGIYKWTKTTEAMFAAKYTVITIALWLPSVIKSSAYFNYTEKGLWALIMAQMTVNVYASDQIFNYVTRLAGTFVGLILGLLAWYIGSGSGNGNPYGLAASMGVFLIPMVFLRLFAPPQYLTGVIMATVTFALIVGYSWIDANLPTYGNPGVGWSVAWRRWVLVVIGCAASFIIMMFPPKSGRKAVRLRNAATIKRISNLYGLLISKWITIPKADNDLGGKVSDSAAKAWTSRYRSELVSIAEQLQALKQMTTVAKWEGSIRGKWPFEEYNRLVEVQMEMLGSLAQLGGALSHLNDEWRLKFIHRTKVLNPNFISDVLSIFALVSQSLRTGEPMHEVLPQTLFERLFYHHSRTSTFQRDSNNLPDLENIQSLDYVYYATGLIAVFELTASLDELHAITRSLCGGVSLRGFEQWRNEYTRSQV